MNLFTFVDKHMGWCVFFGLMSACLFYSAMDRLENYVIQRLNLKLKLGAIERKPQS